jgi:hypothetical protein
MIELTEKLRGYANKIIKETGRQILIHTTIDIGISGMAAYFVEHPTHIFIGISSDMPIELLEQGLAHEFTHGLLAYGRGYCRVRSRDQAGEADKQSLTLLVSMIEDIVVNKIVQSEGFETIPAVYLEEVQRETVSALQGRQHYGVFPDPVFRERFMVYRYIQAWGFLRHIRMGNAERIPLVRYEKAFREAYSKQNKMASKVKAAILKNDIFTSAGYHAVVKEVVKLWGLENVVEIN